MLENTTVTMSLHDFDRYRDAEKAHREIAYNLARCFEYSCTDNPQPQECNKCDVADKWDGSNTECWACEVYQNNPIYTERLTVDVKQLIRVAKEYAVYGKDIETDLDAIKVTPKTEE